MRAAQAAAKTRAGAVNPCAAPETERCASVRPASEQETERADVIRAKKRRRDATAVANADATTETTAVTYGAAENAAKKDAPPRSGTSKPTQLGRATRPTATEAYPAPAVRATATTPTERRPKPKRGTLAIGQQSPTDFAPGRLLAAERARSLLPKRRAPPRTAPSSPAAATPKRMPSATSKPETTPASGRPAASPTPPEDSTTPSAADAAVPSRTKGQPSTYQGRGCVAAKTERQRRYAARARTATTGAVAIGSAKQPFLRADPTTTTKTATTATTATKPAQPPRRPDVPTVVADNGAAAQQV